MAKKINLVQLLESVDANSLRSPDVIGKLQMMLENAVEEAKTAAAEEATETAEAGFKKEAKVVVESFNTLLEQQKSKLDKEYSDKLLEAVEAVKQQKDEELQERVKCLDDESCEELDKIVEAFQEKLDGKDAKIQELEEAIEELDTDHAEKLQEAVNFLREKYEAELTGQDDDHAEKLETVVESMKKKHLLELESIDEEHSSLLEKVIDTVKSRASAEKDEEIDQLDQEITEKVEEIVKMYREKVEAAQKEADEKVVPVTPSPEAGSQDLLAQKISSDNLSLPPAQFVESFCEWTKVVPENFEATYNEAKQAFIKQKAALSPEDRMMESALSVLKRTSNLR